MRKTKAKFRWLALLLAMVSLFGVLAIPASADYYYAMKVSVYYKDESGKTLAPTYTTTVNATTTTLSVPSPAVSGYLLKNDNDASVPYSRMEKHFPASNYVREGSASYTVYYVKASTVCISYAYFDRSGRPSESKMLTGKVGSSYSVVSPTITGFTPSVSCVTGTFQDTSAGKTVYYYENTYQISYDANGGTRLIISVRILWFTRSSTAERRRLFPPNGSRWLFPPTEPTLSGSSGGCPTRRSEECVGCSAVSTVTILPMSAIPTTTAASLPFFRRCAALTVHQIPVMRKKRLPITDRTQNDLRQRALPQHGRSGYMRTEHLC